MKPSRPPHSLVTTLAKLSRLVMAISKNLHYLPPYNAHTKRQTPVSVDVLYFSMTNLEQFLRAMEAG